MLFTRRSNSNSCICTLLLTIKREFFNTIIIFYEKREFHVGAKMKIESYVRVGLFDDAENRRFVSQIYCRSLLLHGLQQNCQAVVEKMSLAFRVHCHRECES